MNTAIEILEFGTIIAGAEEPTGEWIEVFNPYDRSLVGRVAAATTEQVDRLIEEVRGAKVRLTRHDRSMILNKIADRLREVADEMSRLITAESGLCLRDTRYEVTRAIDVLRFAAIRALDDDSEVFPCDVSENGRARRIYTMREPLDLIVAITPFNHPLNQVVHKLAPAIATNNKVILKPSRRTPLSAYRFAWICLDCGLPPEMLGVVCGEDETVADALVRSPRVDLVTFTGGSEVGKQIADRAGYKRLILELGGSSPLLVLEDADLAEAVEIAIAGTFKNSGQRCSAIRRLLVHDAIADDFAVRLTEKAVSILWGNPADPICGMGTVITEEYASLIEARVSKAIERGAELLTGHERRGALYAPTVLDRVLNEDELVAFETFGPVAPIIRFDSLDEALALANDTEYGLTAGVVSNHWPSIQRVISELQTGAVNVNIEPSYRLEWSPFGGFKSSGLGEKEGVVEAMKGMTRIKTYSLPWDKA